MLNCFLSLFVSVQVSDTYVNILSIIVFFSLHDMSLLMKWEWHMSNMHGLLTVA